MKKLLSIAALGSLLATLVLAAAPAWAGSTDERIKALEEELGRLKAEQMELKKEAVAAAAALPTFDYRPGRGMTIAAADKSWSFNVSYRLNIYIYNTVDGKPNYGSNSAGTAKSSSQRFVNTTAMELYPRRNRVYFTYCWADCFYEVETSIDGESAGENGRAASVRDNEVTFHFEQWNPFLPYFSIGLRRGAGRTHISRSSDNDGKEEHSFVLSGFDWGGDGSHSGAGLGWDGVDIGRGEYDLFLNFASSRQGSHQEFVNDDRKGMLGYIGGKPFSKTKNKWIEGLELGLGWQFESQDKAENFDSDAPNSGNEIRVRSTERRGRQDLFRPTRLVSSSDQNVGPGFSWVLIPGLRYKVGPYMFRAVWLKTQFAGELDGLRGVEAQGWTIDNQAAIWSPKGFFTGSTSTPHSIILSFGFERADMNCGLGCDAARSGTARFHSNTILNRETAIWYWVRPSLGLGWWWHRWTAANTPTRSQVALGCKKDIVAADAGKSSSRKCDWDTINLGFRFRF